MNKNAIKWIKENKMPPLEKKQIYKPLNKHDYVMTSQ